MKIIDNVKVIKSNIKNKLYLENNNKNKYLNKNN